MGSGILDRVNYLDRLSLSNPRPPRLDDARLQVDIHGWAAQDLAMLPAPARRDLLLCLDFFLPDSGFHLDPAVRDFRLRADLISRNRSRKIIFMVSESDRSFYCLGLVDAIFNLLVNEIDGCRQPLPAEGFKSEVDQRRELPAQPLQAEKIQRISRGRVNSNNLPELHPPDQRLFDLCVARVLAQGDF